MNYSGEKRPHRQSDHFEQFGANGVVCELLLGRENARLRHVQSHVQTGISTSPGLVQGISSQSGSWVSGNGQGLYLPGTILTEQEKEKTRQMASERIRVEHAIGGMKRYRILSDRLRVPEVRLYNTVLGVCAGLWNFYLTH